MEIVAGALIGLIAGFLLAAAAATAHDKKIEKSGVWTIGGNAYRLTRIEP